MVIGLTMTRRDYLGVDEVFYHFDLRLAHLQFYWKGGLRSGMYRLIEADICKSKGVCETQKFPDDWRLHKDERKLMERRLTTNTKSRRNHILSTGN